MADKKIQALSAQILPLGLSEADAEKAEKALTTPEVVASMRESRRDTFNAMTHQVRECSMAILDVNRQENVVTIKWDLKESVENPQQISVTGTAWEIKFSPDLDAWTGGLIVSTDGSGSVRLELEEGISYQFKFFFMDKDTVNKEDKEMDLDVVFFQVAIPLSDERKALLRKAVTLNFQPDEAIRHEVNSFMGKRAALDEALKDGIAQIKAKKLRPKDEKEAIKDLNLHVKSLINKFQA